MPKGLSTKRALIVDDEPEYLTWLEDFLESQGLTVEIATDLPSAMKRNFDNDYVLCLVDMNIPKGPTPIPPGKPWTETAVRYPGLAFIAAVRNQGYSSFQVIAYTVHDDPTLDGALRLFNSRYVLKARPEVLKSVIRKSLGIGESSLKKKIIRTSQNKRRR